MDMVVNKASNCLNCNAKLTNKFEFFNDIPTSQVSIRNVEDSVKGNITLSFCYDCNLIYNIDFDSSLIDYSSNYNNCQAYSNAFNEHINKITNKIVDKIIDKSSVLEIGCGNGYFLRELHNSNKNAFFYGYDESYVPIPDDINLPNIQFFNKYYQKTDQLFDFIILRHVIEHIENPYSMLELIYHSLSDNGVFYIETPAFEWIMHNSMIYDICYEHCSYFTKDTLTHMLNKIGFELVDFDYTFSGQYLSFWVRKSKKFHPISIVDSNSLISDINNFKSNSLDFINQKISTLQNLKKNGNICFWGAATKGIFACNLFDNQNIYIDFVVDINIAKQGSVIPITGHKIVSPETIKNNINYVLVLNENYFDEIVNSISSIDCNIEVIKFY